MRWRVQSLDQIGEVGLGLGPHRIAPVRGIGGQLHGELGDDRVDLSADLALQLAPFPLLKDVGGVPEQEVVQRRAVQFQALLAF